MQTSFVKCSTALFLAFVMYVVWNIVMLYFCRMLKCLMILINTRSCPSFQKPHGAKQMLSVYVSRMTHCTMLIIMRIVPVLCFVLIQLFCEAKRTAPSILYIPHMQRWWDTVSSALRATFLSLLQDIPSFSPILLLATCNLPYHSLYTEVCRTF